MGHTRRRISAEMLARDAERLLAKKGEVRDEQIEHEG